MPDQTNINEGPEPRRRPVAGELFIDSGARAAWAAIENLEPGLKHDILRALSSRMATPDAGATPDQLRVARAIAALREAADELQRETGSDDLSVWAYRRLAAERGREYAWPPDGSIRRWLGGSWNDALRRAGLRAVPDGDALIREQGPAYTKAELLAAVTGYVADSGEVAPAAWRYLMWAKRPDVRRRPGRRPRSLGPFLRHYEGWGDVLAAAGVGTAPAPSGKHCAVVAGGVFGAAAGMVVYSRSGYGYSDEQVRAGLIEVAERLGAREGTGRRSPKTLEYARERAAIMAEEQEAGLPLRAIVSLGTIQARYEHWDSALIDAGLEPVNGRHNKVYRRVPSGARGLTDREILGCLRDAHAAAMAAGEERLTVRFYKAWRIAERRRLGALGQFRPIPAHCNVWKRLGDFQLAVARAVADLPPAEPDEPVEPGEPQQGRAEPAGGAADSEQQSSGQEQRASEQAPDPTESQPGTPEAGS
jgi:hypothetical protein